MSECLKTVSFSNYSNNKKYNTTTKPKQNNIYESLSMISNNLEEIKHYLLHMQNEKK